MTDTATRPDTVCPDCLQDFAKPGRHSSVAYRAMTIHRARVHLGHYGRNGDTPIPSDAGTDPPAPGTTPPQDAHPAPGDTEETNPAPRKPTLWNRWKARRAGAKPSTSTGERAPKRGGGKRRVPLDTDISDIWAFLGRRLEAGPHFPTGRMLQLQAPASGVILDKAVAGTLPDRLVLQPLARSRDKWEDAAFLVAGPLVTYSITRTLQEMEVVRKAGDMETFGALNKRLELQKEGFEWLVRMMLPRLAVGKKKAEERKAKDDAVIADAFPELADTGFDPVEVLMGNLFEPSHYVQTEGEPDVGTGTAAAQAPGEGPLAE